MKFSVAIAAIFLVAAVTAQTAQPTNEGRHLAELLFLRANALIASSKATIQMLYKEGKGHLASSVEHQIVLVEALSLDLKAHLADQSKSLTHHMLHTIEESLLYLENRIGEELYIIQHIGDNHHNDHNGTDTMAQKLVAHAQSIIHQAEEVLKQHEHSRKVRSIQIEIAEIEKLIKAIQSHPSPAEFKQEAQQLARHEQTLQHLVERATHGHHGNTMMPPTHNN